jgi:hypothetical protein
MTLVLIIKSGASTTEVEAFQGEPTSLERKVFRLKGDSSQRYPDF